MIPSDPFTPPPAAARWAVAGTGRLTLDAIVQGDSLPRSQAGGTCGNVLIWLSWLGWDSYPLTNLGDDDPGRRFVADLERWGVHLDLIRHLPGERSPVIVHHIRPQPDGGVEHSFTSQCPFCDARLRYYEPVPLPDVQERLPSVPPVQAFFFDRDSDGSVLLARHCREQGALIVFEPNYAGDEVLFPQAFAACHVLKISRERLPGLADRLPELGPWLIIETLGAEGLRFRDQRQGSGHWHHLPALTVAEVRDAAGAGDACTAGFVHLLGRQGASSLRTASGDDLRQALRFGQALAAWTCAFEGARGGMYAATREQFRWAVESILAGVLIDPGSPVPLPEAGAFCWNCGGRPHS